MPNIAITDLPAALPLTGTELVPIVQDGVTVRATTAAVAGSPILQQTFLTIGLESTLPNSRYISVGAGLTTTDGGSQGVFQISPTGALSSLINAPSGILAKTASTTITSRAIQVTGQGLSITNGSGVAGDPTIQLTGLPATIAGLSGYGFLTLLGAGATIRQLDGTNDQISITNPQGTAGNPTVGLASNPVFAPTRLALGPLGGPAITQNTNTATAGGGGDHTHPFSFSSGSGTFSGNAINLAVKYYDFIIASKD
jgi:hypothetical protein